MEGESYRRRFLETERPALWKRLVEDAQTSPVAPPILVVKTEKDERPAPGSAVETPKSSSPIRDSRSPISDSQPPVRAANGPIPGSNTTEAPHRPSEHASVPPRPPAIEDPKVTRIEPDLPKKSRWPVDPVSPGTDPLKLSHDEEVKLGQAVHELIRQHHRLSVNPAFINRLYSLAVRFRDQRARKDVDIKIFLLDSDEAVTFSHLGGYIYLGRCLERLIPNDVEFEFLIAHEIAHVDQRHGLQQVARTLAGRPSIGPDEPGLVRRIYHQIAAGHDPDQERAADEWAARQLLRLGRTRREILSFLRRLETYRAREEEDPNKPHKPSAVLEAEVQDIEAHLQRHPPIPYRLHDLEKVIGAGPPAQ
jgi:hypothetical protein